VSDSPSQPAQAPPDRPRRALPLWLWMLLLTAAIVALLFVVGRDSFAP
jgi:hypothetical protein